MIIFPKAKINLGLNVVERRPDGYHNLETVFLEVPLSDALEVQPMDPSFPSDVDCDLQVTGIPVEGDVQRNLVVRAYQQLKADFPSLARVHVHLYKRIPTQAGMGGGSSDAAAMLRLLNTLFGLKLSTDELIRRAALLGADCPFFILGGAAYGEGIGERLQPVGIDFSGWSLAVVRPAIPIPTREAFALVRPMRPQKNVLDIVRQPVESWRGQLVNDFERSVFAQHPEIADVRDRLYELGATYSAMSGSGSAVYGFFRQPVDLSLATIFPDMYTALLPL